jgi:hypothetical protein
MIRYPKRPRLIPYRGPTRSARTLRCGTALVLLPIMTACSDMPVANEASLSNARPAAAQPIVTACHGNGANAHPIHVALAAFAAHLAHGDYVAHLIVDPSVTGGDGVHFARITDALAAARTARVARNELVSAACRITIDVAPGVYTGTNARPAGSTFEELPLIIDFPDLTLRGAHAMVVDARGRATGASASGLTSLLRADAPLASAAQYSEPLIFVNAEPNGFQGNGVMVEGFTFNPGRASSDQTIGGAAIVTLRVQDLVITDNAFDKGFSESIDLRASSADVSRNFLGATGAAGGGTCDICLAGPGSYVASGNRLLAGGIPGFLIVPATLLPVPTGVTQHALPAASTVAARVENNEVRDHLRLPVGVGIRVGAIGIGAPNVAGTVLVEARDNTLINNRFGMIVEAAFPVLNTLRRGNVDLTIAGNEILQSCQAPLLVSLSRHTTGLGLSNLPYLFHAALAAETA